MRAGLCTSGSRTELDGTELVGGASGINTTQDGGKALLRGCVGENGRGACGRLFKDLALF